TGARTTVNSGSGTVLVQAISTNTANATVGGGLGGLVDLGVLLDSTTLGGSTSAYVGGSTTITAGEGDGTATAANPTNPTASLVDISLGGADGANCTATLTHTVSAYVAAGSTVNVTAGKFAISATSTNTVSSNASGASVGIAGSVLALVSKTSLGGSTLAYV